MCASFSGVSPVFASEGIGVSTGGRSQSSPSHRNKGTRAASPLAAFAALLVGRQPDDIPVLHNASTVQRVVHAEFRMLQQLLTTLTPMASSVSASGSASSRYRNTTVDRLQLAVPLSLSLLVRLPEPTFGMFHSVSPPLPRWCGCLVCFCNNVSKLVTRCPRFGICRRSAPHESPPLASLRHARLFPWFH